MDVGGGGGGGGVIWVCFGHFDMGLTHLIFLEWNSLVRNSA